MALAMAFCLLFLVSLLCCRKSHDARAQGENRFFVQLARLDVLLGLAVIASKFAMRRRLVFSMYLTEELIWHDGGGVVGVSATCEITRYRFS